MIFWMVKKVIVLVTPIIEETSYGPWAPLGDYSGNNKQQSNARYPSCLRQAAAPGRVAEVLLMQQLAMEPRGAAWNSLETCGKL